MYCDVVNVQPCFNFSNEIIILKCLCMGKYMHTHCGEGGLDNSGLLLEKRKHTHAHT